MKSNFLKVLLVFALASFSFISCNQSSECEVTNPNNDCPCYLLYAPVCGCNDVTYVNDCEAECAGITEYTAGPCN